MNGKASVPHPPLGHLLCPGLVKALLGFRLGMFHFVPVKAEEPAESQVLDLLEDVVAQIQNRLKAVLGSQVRRDVPVARGEVEGLALNALGAYRHPGRISCPSRVGWQSSSRGHPLFWSYLEA